MNQDKLGLKLSKKELPKALVICNAAPKNIANKKKINIFLCLNNTKASNPNEERNDLILFDLTGGQGGIVNAYIPKTNAEAALKINCILVASQLQISTIHIAAIKPIVPQTLIGENLLQYQTLFVPG